MVIILFLSIAYLNLVLAAAVVVAMSMLPKVQAAMKFIKANPGKKAIITSLDKAVDALEGRTGTLFTV